MNRNHVGASLLALSALLLFVELQRPDQAPPTAPQGEAQVTEEVPEPSTAQARPSRAFLRDRVRTDSPVPLEGTPESIAADEVARFRGFLNASYDYTAWQECTADAPAPAACEDLLTTALYGAIDGTRSRCGMADAALAPELVSAAAIGACDDPDPATRIARMRCAREAAAGTRLPPPAFAIQCFVSLNERNPAEVAEFLETFRGQAPTEAEREFLLPLAHSPDTRTRRATLPALGHAESASEMADFVSTLIHDGTIDGAEYDILGESLGRCGAACEPTFRAIVESPDDSLRLAGIHGLGMTRDRALIARMTEEYSRDRQGPQEAHAWERLQHAAD